MSRSNPAWVLVGEPRRPTDGLDVGGRERVNQACLHGKQLGGIQVRAWSRGKGSGLDTSWVLYWGHLELWVR